MLPVSSYTDRFVRPDVPVDNCLAQGEQKRTNSQTHDDERERKGKNVTHAEQIHNHNQHPISTDSRLVTSPPSRPIPHEVDGVVLDLNSPTLSRQHLVSLVELTSRELKLTQEKLAERDKELSQSVKKLLYHQRQLKTTSCELVKVLSVLTTLQSYTVDGQFVTAKLKGGRDVAQIVKKYASQTVELAKLRVEYEEMVNLIGGRGRVNALKQSKDDRPLVESIFNDVTHVSRDNSPVARDDTDSAEVEGKYSEDNEDTDVDYYENCSDARDEEESELRIDEGAGVGGEKGHVGGGSGRTIDGYRSGAKSFSSKVPARNGKTDGVKVRGRYNKRASKTAEDIAPKVKRGRKPKMDLARVVSQENTERGELDTEETALSLCEVKMVDDDGQPLLVDEIIEKLVNETNAEGEQVTHVEAYNSSDGTKVHLYNCAACAQNITPDKIVKHLRIHPAPAATKPFICRYCGRSYLRNGGLKRHMINHTENKPTCLICHRSFTQWATLTDHVNFIHRGLKQHQCDVCQKFFSHRGNLNTHMRIHTGERPFVCDVCGRAFYEQCHLTDHRRAHTGEKPFPCGVCGRAYRTLKSLKTHAATHSVERPIICDLCGKGFNAMSNYRIHYKTHSNPLPWSCKICDKSYSHPSTLRAHVLRHTQRREHLCTICGRGFYRAEHLDQHYNRHANIKGYVCSFCGKGFIDKVRLKYHQAVHTGDKPYHCEICGRNFTIPSILKTHKKTHERYTPKIS